MSVDTAARMVALSFGVVAVLFLLAVMAVSIASCVVNNWLEMTSAPASTPTQLIGATQGLWQACTSVTCFSISNVPWDSDCMPMLNAVRAFTIITSGLAFLAVVPETVSLFSKSTPSAVFAMGCSVFAMLASIIPWVVYMYYRSSGCTLSSAMTRSAGWSLSVSAFPLAFVAMLAAMLWYLAYRNYWRPARVPLRTPSVMCPPPSP
eukprot:RCo045902